MVVREIGINEIDITVLDSLPRENNPLFGDRLAAYDVTSFYGSTSEISRFVSFDYKDVRYCGDMWLHNEYLMTEKMAAFFMSIMQVTIRAPTKVIGDKTASAKRVVYSVYIERSSRAPLTEAREEYKPGELIEHYTKPSKGRKGKENDLPERVDSRAPLVAG